MNNGFVKNQRAHDLYVNKPLLKAILRVVLPSLLMTLMTGVYIFVSQVIIVRLVPISHGNTAENFNYWFGMDYATIYGLAGKDHFYDVGDVVRGATSISSPILTIIGTSPFFIAGGASVLFTQAMGRSSKYKAEQVFKTSFWMVVILTVTETLILLSTNKLLLTAMTSPAEQVGDPSSQLQLYYNKVHDLQIEMASQWTLIYSAGLIFPMLAYYLAGLVKAESKFKVVVISSVCCNVLNIGLTCLLILVAKLDMYGGSTSAVISQAVNLSVVLIYIGYMNRKQNTWLNFGVLFKKGVAKFRTNLIAPIILIGLSAFLIDVSYAVANIFYIPILANTAANIFDHANRNGMYFQTIEGAIMPALNLLFITVYGIADGERLIVAYNYSLGNWKRIKKTYQYTIFITFIYCTCAVLLVCVALGQPILQLFGIDKSTVMFQDAYNVVLIQSLMVVVFSLQVAAMSLFMSISDIVRSNIAAIFQDTIIFFPVLGVCYGITMATGNIWILVSTYVINAIIATILMTIYTIWWLKHRFGKIPMKTKINDVTKTLWTPVTIPRPTFIQNALDWE